MNSTYLTIIPIMCDNTLLSNLRQLLHAGYLGDWV